MATLPAPGVQISVSQINSLKSKPNTNSNITTREQEYMGGNPGRPSISGVCMPNDVIIVTDSANNTGTLAKDKSGPDYSWVYSGPGTGGAWTPTSLSEFAAAYNNPPSVTVNAAPVGCPNSPSCRYVTNRTLTFSNGVGPYYYATGETCTNTPTFGGWSGSATSGPVVTNGLALPACATVYLWAAVRDSLNCGGAFDLYGVDTYP